MMNSEALKEGIKKIALDLCNTLGLELVELNLKMHQGTLNIELLVDLAAGGVDIDACTRMNRLLDKELYEVMKLGDNYTLEVSSPGADRALTVPADFRRSMGKNIRLFLRERVQGKMEMDAVIQGVQGDEIVFNTKLGEMRLKQEMIDRGKLILF